MGHAKCCCQTQWPEFGSLKLVASTLDAVVAGTYYKISGYDAGTDRGVTPDLVAGALVVQHDGLYKMHFEVSFSASAGGDITGRLFKNDVEQIYAGFERDIQNINDDGAASGKTDLKLVAGDVLDYRLSNSNPTTTILMATCDFDLLRIGG